MSNVRNWIICGVLLAVLFCGVTVLPPFVYLGAAFFAFSIGNAELKKGSGQAAYVPRPGRCQPIEAGNARKPRKRARPPRRGAAARR